MSTSKTKPPKPYPDFPLFWHPGGSWAKKIRGKTHYFGANAQDAMVKYEQQRDDLQAGRVPRPQTNSEGLTVAELADKFLTHKSRLIASGELSLKSMNDYFNTCERVVEAFGRNVLVEQLRPDDFSHLRAKLAAKYSLVALGNRIQRVRTMFKLAYEQDWISRPVKFGSDFKKPARDKIRAERFAKPTKMMDPEDLQKIIKTAKPALRAMILLALNGGFGQTDCACLPISAIDFERNMITFPRPKTAVKRRFPMWTETAKALREAIANRPVPSEEADAGLVFITKYGNRWVQVVPAKGVNAIIKGGTTIDSIGREFIKLLNKLGMKKDGQALYVLRHIHRTISDECLDEPAADLVMGHKTEGISDEYREQIGNDRLQRIVDHVHDWLYPPKKAAKKPRTKS